jgi:hypothetical protein
VAVGLSVKLGCCMAPNTSVDWVPGLPRIHKMPGSSLSSYSYYRIVSSFFSVILLVETKQYYSRDRPGGLWGCEILTVHRWR